MSTHIETPAFTDDPTQADLDGYYYAPIETYTLFYNSMIKLNFDYKSPTKLSKGSYITYDRNKDSCWLYLYSSEEKKKIQLKSIVIKDILYVPRESAKVTDNELVNYSLQKGKSGLLWFAGSSDYDIEIKFFSEILYHVSYIISSGKECKTHFYIYNTSFYNYLQWLIDLYHYVNKLRHDFYNYYKSDPDDQPFLDPTAAIPVYGTIKQSRLAEYRGNRDKLNYELKNTVKISRDQLKRYMNIYPTFLHIFKDA